MEKTITYLDDIVHDVSKVNEVITEITEGAKEQTSGIEQINKAIADLDAVTQTNAGIAEETSASTHLLQEKAKNFLSVVEFFKIEGMGKSIGKERERSSIKKIKEVKPAKESEIKIKETAKQANKKAEKLIPFDDEIEEI